jgi:hypothetical protein
MKFTIGRSRFHRAFTSSQCKHLDHVACRPLRTSRRARIPSPPAEPSVLALWSNQGTRRFSGEPPQTPHASFYLTTPSIGRAKPFTTSSRKVYLVLPYSLTWLLPCTSSSPRLRLPFLATMRPALDPVRLPIETCLLISPLLGSPLFICTNANQAATCTCNNRRRVSPHNLVNHSSRVH